MRSILGFMCFCSALVAADPSSEPILRIETGFHTLSIHNVDASADGRVLVTSSEDKTLRTWRWDGKKLEAETVYRVPLGEGNEGQLYAVAISPDGRWLVTGGWTGWKEDQAASVYIIDRQSGQLARRVGGMPGLIFDLVIAPGGDAVLVCLGDNAGLRCLSLPDGQEKGRDTEYSAACERACWLPDGGCATTSNDGHVRRYDSTGHMTAKVVAPLGKMPVGIDHHDGTLAVGYMDAAAVSLLRTDSLATVTDVGKLDPSIAFQSSVGQPVSVGVSEGGTSSVCAAHGRWWAGGDAAFLGGPLIHSWSIGGGTPQAHAQFAGSSTIMDIRRLPSGILAASDTPWLHLLAPTGEIMASLEPLRWTFGAYGASLMSEAQGKRIFSTENMVVDLETGTAGRLTDRQWMWCIYADQPGDPDRAFTMAWNLLDDEPHDPVTAEKLARAGLALPGADQPALRDTLAEALLQQNRFDEALVEQKEAVRLAKAMDPPYDEAILSGYVENLDAITKSEKKPVVIPPCVEPYSTSSKNHFERATTVAPGIDLQTTDAAVTLNGHSVTLGASEYILFSAIPPSKQLIVLASKQYLRALNPEGTEIWSQELASEPKGVVCPSKAAVVITTSIDGTVRWYRLSDGVEVLTCFVDKDGQRWVAWTPSGYYWAGPNSEELIGWHINRGKDQLAEFYPVSRFADRFNRPDIVKHVLSTWKTDVEIVKEFGGSDNIAAAVKGVPVVRITSPVAASVVPAGTEEVVVEAEVQNTGGGIDEVRVLVNGKALDGTERGMRPTTAAIATSYRWVIPVAPGANEIRITAFNTRRTESNPAVIQITCPERQATSTLYGIAIAVGAYENPKYQLNWTIADAQSVMEAVSRSGKPLFESVQWTALFDAQVSKASIRTAFLAVQGKAKPGDTLLVFYAGHGVMSEGSSGVPGTFYLIPPSIRQLYGHDDDLAANAVSATDLRDWCKAIPAQKQILLLDACESGSAVETVALRGASEERALAQLSRSAGLSIIAAAGSAQGANEVKALGHGVFTYALIEGLSGKARSGDRPVTVRSLDAWLSLTVPELTKKYRAQMQIPTSCHRGQDFPLSLP